MIAMALVHNPDVLIADEPTTALDVTVQAQILELIDKVKQEFDVGVILITHDLGVVAETATHVMVMYAGRAMEYGAAAEIFTGAQHPYTWGLLESMPTVEQEARRARPDRGLAAVAAPSAVRLRRSTRAASTASSRARPSGRRSRRSPAAISTRACSRPTASARSGGRSPRSLRRARCAAATRIDATRHDRRTTPRRGRAHLTKHFPVKQGVFARGKSVVHAVEDVNLTVQRGETLGIVGESGCGKSTTARLMVRLLDADERNGHLRRQGHHEAEPARRCGRFAGRCRSSSRTRTRR